MKMNFKNVSTFFTLNLFRVLPYISVGAEFSHLLLYLVHSVAYFNLKLSDSLLQKLI